MELSRVLAKGGYQSSTEAGDGVRRIVTLYVQPV